MSVTLPESLYQLRVFTHRFRQALLLGFFIPVALFFVLSFVPMPRYTAESVVIVRLGPESVYQPEAQQAATVPHQAIPPDREQMAKSEMAILNSADLHAAVIRAMGIDILFPELQHPAGIGYVSARVRGALAFMGRLLRSPNAASEEEEQRKLMARAQEKFSKRFDVQVEKDSAVIHLTFEHSDDMVARKTLETLLSLYLEKRREYYRDDRATLAETQWKDARAKAMAAEQEVAQFKHDHQVYEFETQRAELLRQRDQARTQAVNIVHAGLSNKIATYNKQLDALNASESQLILLKNDAADAAAAVTIAAHTLEEARAYEARLQEHVQSVRVVQSPTTPAEPKSLQWAILALGAFVGAVCSFLVGIYCKHSYNTTKVVTLLRQRKKRAHLRVV